MSHELLSEDYQDTLTELFNIGMGRAADSLSEMLSDEIILTVPQLEVMSYYQAMAMYLTDGNKRINAVEQKFAGDFSGSSFLFFSDDSSSELLKRLLGTDIPADELGELEQEALKEVANIIFNACFGCIADVLDCHIDSGVPHLLCGNIEDVLNIERMQLGQEPTVLTLSITFSLPNKLIHGRVSLLMTSASVNQLVHELERYMQLYV